MQTEFEYVNKRGEKLFARKVIPNEKPVIALMLWFHGMHGHTGAVPDQLFINTMAKIGIACVCYDQIGHGKSVSDDLRGHLVNWEYLIDDGVHFIKQYFAGKLKDVPPMDVPFFIAGASMGGCVTLLTSLRVQDAIINGDMKDAGNWLGSAMFAPALFNDIQPPWVVLQGLKLVASMGGGKLKWGPEPDPEKFESPEIYKLFLADPLTYSDAMHLSMGKNLLDMTDYAKTMLDQIHFPFLVVHHENDPVIPARGSRQIYDSAQSTEKDVKVISTEQCVATHLIHSKEPAMEMTIEWVNNRLQAHQDSDK